MENLFGAEFPEAFGSTDGGPDKSKKTILDLPVELLEIVCEYISKLDIKRLRLASKHLADSVYLRIDRVFISPNRANLDYLNTILAHPRYKGRVQEIVYDSTRLASYSTLERFRKAIVIDEKDIRRAISSRLEEAIEIYGDDSPQYRLLDVEGIQNNEDGYLTDTVKEILLRYEDDFSRDVLARNATMMSTEDSYAVYQALYHEEQEIVKQQLDADALQRALAGFPKLKRVTLTSEAWWPWNIRPRYNTPFHRSLPPGFRKPLIYTDRDRPGPLHNVSWYPDAYSSECRCYKVILSALLSMPIPSIEEFIVDSYNLHNGIPEHIFDSGSSIFENTRLMFQRTPLKRLRLSFCYCSCADPNGRQRSIDNNIVIPLLLSELKQLEHLDLSIEDRGNDSLVLSLIKDQEKARLKTLTLREFRMPDEALFNTLVALKNAEHITLYHMSNIIVPTRWAQLLQRLKEHYATTMEGTKPHYTIIESIPLGEPDNFSSTAERFSHLVDEEVDAFLYGGADCPFLEHTEAEDEWNQMKTHVGWRVHDRDWEARERMAEFCEREGMLEWEEEM